jgi:hypothetical protein
MQDRDQSPLAEKLLANPGLPVQFASRALLAAPRQSTQYYEDLLVRAVDLMTQFTENYGNPPNTARNP